MLLYMKTSWSFPWLRLKLPLSETDTQKQPVCQKLTSLAQYFTTVRHVSPSSTKMWPQLALKEDLRRSGVRFTLPALSNNKGLLTSSPEFQRSKVLKPDREMVCSLGEDISRIPSNIRCTMMHLSARHMEVSQWQAYISDSMGRVDREIAALEQMKAMTECCLQERQLYSRLMSDCVALRNSLGSARRRQDCVFVELNKEEQLTTEIRGLLQKQISILFDKLSSMKNIRTQLLADFHNKREAIKLTTKCIIYELDTPSSRLPADQYKLNHVSYDKWLSHCKDLRATADNQTKDSSSFRGNLRFILVNMRNGQERQRRSTDDALRKKINELNGVQETLMWERHRVKGEISDLTTDVQKVVGQIRNCDSKLHQATHRLEILNERPRYELCLDHPYISLTLEQQDLAKMAAGLHSVLKHLQQDLELARRHLMILEDKLARNTLTLQVEQKCQNMHRCFLPVLDTAKVLANKPRFPAITGSSSSRASLQ